MDRKQALSAARYAIEEARSYRLGGLLRDGRTWLAYASAVRRSVPFRIGRFPNASHIARLSSAGAA